MVEGFWYWMIVCHLIGDYVLQSDWMALKKTERSFEGAVAAAVHSFLYALPFWGLFCLSGMDFWSSWQATVLIAGTHAFIDHIRIARLVCWLKNFLSPRDRYGSPTQITMANSFGFSEGDLVDIGGEKVRVTKVENTTMWAAPRRWWHSWESCSLTGYQNNKPAWMSVWLMIITDNTLHLICNGLAVLIWRTT